MWDINDYCKFIDNMELYKHIEKKNEAGEDMSTELLIALFTIFLFTAGGLLLWFIL